MLITVARHPNTPPELLSRLSRALSRDLRIAVAAHPELPATDLTRLSRSSMPEIRSRVAAHPNCSPRVLTRLAREPDCNVVAAAARNPNCTAELLAEMVEREPMAGWNYVRAAVAAHPNTPPDTLKRLHSYSVSELRRLAGSDPYSEDAYDPNSEFWDPDGEDRLYQGDELVWGAAVIQQAVETSWAAPGTRL